MITISLKFCGGCNPAYDRTRLARWIRTALDGRCRFVGSGLAPAADRILIIHGCPTACGECDPALADRTTHIRSHQDGEAFILVMLDGAEPSSGAC